MQSNIPYWKPSRDVGFMGRTQNTFKKANNLLWFFPLHEELKCFAFHVVLLLIKMINKQKSKITLCEQPMFQTGNFNYVRFCYIDHLFKIPAHKLKIWHFMKAINIDFDFSARDISSGLGIFGDDLWFICSSGKWSDGQRQRNILPLLCWEHVLHVVDSHIELHVNDLITCTSEEVFR